MREGAGEKHFILTLPSIFNTGETMTFVSFWDVVQIDLLLQLLDLEA